MNIDLWLEKAIKKIKSTDPNELIKQLESFGLVQPKSKWIKCSEKMPIVMEDVRVYKSVEVIVTDGVLVKTCDCCAGMPNNDPEKFWVSFSHYGNMPSSQITHWQPLPPPPEDN